MTVYREGHVRHNPETKEVAVRTTFSEDNPQFARLAWLVATTVMGARNAFTADVEGEGWVDLWVPPAPTPETPPGEGE